MPKTPPQPHRLYWLLVIKGPMTLPEIRAETNWTPHDAYAYLRQLQRQDCVQLIERGQHRSAQNHCGKWQAILEGEIVDAESVPA